MTKHDLSQYQPITANENVVRWATVKRKWTASELLFLSPSQFNAVLFV